MAYSSHLLRHYRLIIGQNIHRLRSQHRMPLPRLAEISGVPELKIDHYELGKGEIPLDHALRLACALNAPLDALLK